MSQMRAYDDVFIVIIISLKYIFTGTKSNEIYHKITVKTI